MTVGELIEELRKCPRDYDIQLRGDGSAHRVYEDCIERDSVVVGEFVVIEGD
jgi:hypothetical protein